MTGMYGGLVLTLMVLLLARRMAARRPGSWPVLGILVLFFLSMAFDGLNSTLAELGLSQLDTSTNTGRLVTGLLAGIALAPGLFWLLGVVNLRPGAGVRDAVMCTPFDLVLPLLLAVLFGLLVRDGRAALYYPIALVSVLGVVVALTCVAWRSWERVARQPAPFRHGMRAVWGVLRSCWRSACWRGPQRCAGSVASELRLLASGVDAPGQPTRGW